MSNCLIRPAEAADASRLVEIEGITEAALGRPVADPRKRLTFWREAIEFSEPFLMVASDGDQVVGFIGYDRSRDPRTPPTMGEIWAIYVLGSHLGQGVGLSLWDAAREGLLEEGCTQVSVWIELAMERALRFHELAGFKRDMPSLRTVAKGNTRIEEIRLKRPL